jgi:hypothetical protein
MSEYFTKEFLEAALIKDLQKVNIINFDASQANQSGDNYTSIIHRVEVKYRSNDDEEMKNISLIVKYMIETEAMLDALKDFEPFKKEKEMYSTILSEFQRISVDKFAPISYHVAEKPKKIFVMEDLKASGYSIPNRVTGLDIEHCKIVMEKLAKFHAISMILADKVPNVYDTFYFGFFHPRSEETRGPLIEHFADNLKLIIESLRQSDEMKYFVTKLEALEVCWSTKQKQLIPQCQ